MRVMTRPAGGVPPVRLTMLPPHALRVGQWAVLGARAFKIIDMRVVGTGRTVRFDGHAPVFLHWYQTLPVYLVGESTRR
ncbi:hypothetical protein VSR01_16055 [Actinacidiphila sp. DG2A-62]|uniref:hypothetical protein n=1 Tax=Actinacidiphila sp. DG2A-62 TaxID=3108821 RepID=UPI002DBA8CCE|nr:hypothetical protein [Actinacidiphila sp. DG2A-62]MEC3994958.1 hypothetical protein [Actinacidiphila sp. DG2A-62]